MELNIQERMAMINILPEQGSRLEQIIVRDILEKVKITQDEMEQIEMNFLPNGNVIWKRDVDIKKNIEFTDKEMEIMKKQNDNLDRQGKISQDTLSLSIKIAAFKNEEGEEKEESETKEDEVSEDEGE